MATSLYRIDSQGKLVLLPVLGAHAEPGETFPAGDKFFSPECGGRNTAAAHLLRECCHAARRLGERYVRFVVVESANNLSIFYAVLVALQEPGVHVELHAISRHVTWSKNQYELVKGRVSFFWHASTKAYHKFMGKQASVDVFFLDTCNSIFTMINDVYETLDTLNRGGGVWGITWTNNRHGPTKKNLANHANDHTRELLAELKRTWTAGQDRTDWVLRYCHLAASRAGFALRVAYADEVKEVTTMLFRAVPLRAPRPRDGIVYDRKSAFVAFWKDPRTVNMKELRDMYFFYVLPVFAECAEF